MAQSKEGHGRLRPVALEWGTAASEPGEHSQRGAGDPWKDMGDRAGGAGLRIYALC